MWGQIQSGLRLDLNVELPSMTLLPNLRGSTSPLSSLHLALLHWAFPFPLLPILFGIFYHPN